MFMNVGVSACRKKLYARIRELARWKELVSDSCVDIFADRPEVSVPVVWEAWTRGEGG